MADRIFRRYTCDVDGDTAVVRFVFQLPGMKPMVVDLCESLWSPIESTLREAVDRGGARPVRDPSMRSSILVDEDSLDDGPAPVPSRPARGAPPDAAGGRWVASMGRTGNGGYRHIEHWCFGEPLRARCGLAGPATLDPAQPVSSTVKRCAKCQTLIRGDGIDASPPPVPPADGDAALFPRPHAAGQFVDVAASLPFDEWPRFSRWEWVDYGSRPSTVRAHARRVAGGVSLCSRVDAERLAEATPSTGEAPLCSLCMGTANKILRDERLVKGAK
jgi:hypothetical protein